MARTKNEKKSLSKEDIFNEIKELSEKAKQKSNHQLDLGFNTNLGDEDIDFDFDVNKLKDTADPEESYRLYYGMRRLLIDNLPQGKENKKLRQHIYNEKNLFLNRGADISGNNIRGSDGRMTYIIPFLRDAFETVVKWLVTGANPFDIYSAFYDMNEERGFHAPKEAVFSKNKVL